MRKLMMKMSMSLDGFVSAPDDKNDWIIKTGDEESKAWSVGLCWESGLHIVGRKTFQSWVTYWPTATGPFAAPMNEIPKAVFTQKGFARIPPSAEQSPAAASWADARVFDGDLTKEIRKLKAEPGKPILAYGGVEFMRSLIATGLIDEYHLAIHPIALGSGASIFTGLAIPLYLKLVNAKAFPGGVVVHHYRPAQGI